MMLRFAETFMSTCADIEVCIRRQADGSYTADLRLQTPDNAVAAELATRQPVALDFATLRQLSLDPEAYGRHLTAMVFAEENVRLGRKPGSATSGPNRGSTSAARASQAGRSAGSASTTSTGKRS
jgi:hypothetical protein